MKTKEIKNNLKKFWDFIWNDDSWQSWVVSLILAFLIIKFIFFPLLSLIFGSSMPLVVVESSSMHHDGFFISNWFQLSSSFNAWWDQYNGWYLNKNITIEGAKNWPLKTGFEQGDIIVLWRPTHLQIGDIIVFSANTQHPIIHRIINITTDNTNRTIYSTKGDNNNLPGGEQHPFEKQIAEEQIIGKAIFIIPKLGWIKLFLFRITGLA